MGGSTLSACRARRSPSFSPLLASDARAAKLRAKQVFHWIYHRVTDFDAMTDIAKTMRPWLSQRFVIDRPSIVTAQASSDGTRKVAFAHGGQP
jgi:adenine C2-methylase RlmN of 23S rRNA A2503 and tRNA A37